MKNFSFKINGNPYQVSVDEAQEGKAQVTVNGKAFAVEMEKPAAAAPVAKPVAKPAAPKPAAAPAAAPQPAAAAGAKSVISPLPGSIVRLQVNVGDAVKRGDTLLVIESMKMENNIPAPRDGQVSAVYVQAGQSVMQGAALLDLD